MSSRALLAVRVGLEECFEVMMALIRCNECGMMISDTSKSCPHCGSREHRVITAWHYFMIVSLAIILAGWFFVQKIQEQHKPETYFTEQDEFELIYPVRLAGYRVDEFVRLLSRSADNSTYVVEVREIKGSTTTSGFKVDIVHHTVERRW